MQPYLNDLKAQLGNAVVLDADTLKEYAEDASVFHVTPQAVVQPRSAKEVADLVRFVSDRKETHPELAITARAAGTGMDGGALSEGVILDCMRYLDQLGSLKEEPGKVSASVVVEPGVYYRNLETVATAAGYMLPSFTASKDICALGGMIMNNAAGEYSLKYGSTNTYVESIDMVLADSSVATFTPLSMDELEEKKALNTFEGEIYRKMHTLIESHKDMIDAAKPQVSKNTSGYALWNVLKDDQFDLTQLISGSGGTLGIMTKAQLRLVPKPVSEKCIVIALPNLSVLPDAILALRQEDPVSIECFDENTYALAKEQLPDAAAAVICNEETPLTIIARFAGAIKEEVDMRVERAHGLIESLGTMTCLVADEAEAEHYWQIRRASFSLLRKHAGNTHRAAPFIDDIIVDPAQLPKFLPELREILAEYFLTYTISGHVGEGNFHIIPLVDMRLESERHRMLDLAGRVFSLVHAYGGSMAGEHNDGIIRTPYVERMYGHDMYKLFEEVKEIFDPKNIFNPGKKVNGSIAYALEHFAHENQSEML